MNAPSSRGSSEIDLKQARQAADDIYTQMCSSVAVARISRAERHRRMRTAQSILDKIDADPHGAHLAPKEWKLIREWLHPATQENVLLDEEQDQPEAHDTEDYL